MLVEERTIAKLGPIMAAYHQLRFEKICSVDEWKIHECQEHHRTPPKNVSWVDSPIGTSWGREWFSAWFQTKVKLKKADSNRPLFLQAMTGADETLVFVNDRPKGAFSSISYGPKEGAHTEVLLTKNPKLDDEFQIALEAYTGHHIPGVMPREWYGDPPKEKSRTFKGAFLVQPDPIICKFAYDFRTLLELYRTVPNGTLRKGKVAKGLEQVFSLIAAEPTKENRAHWIPGVEKAQVIIADLLKCRNGSTAFSCSLSGHSHLDTAWLWPIAETTRKAARTFSNALSMMELYPEYRFFQSSPYQTDQIRQHYPKVFSAIQEKVKESRWEPNGGMWIEPDANIPNGESFVRQILYAQKATQQWFGYRADILWLPDTFGYSAALPQLLRLGGMKYFITQKLSWNDTNRFPYDFFVWEGIDGSRVLAHLNFMDTQGPSPTRLAKAVDDIQHPDVQDRVFFAFGFGDGGGGPSQYNIEMARRVEDLEGCPRTRYESASEFMQSAERDLTNLPLWCGELYLELHRGTLTSQAQIKRLNRQNEFAFRELEFLQSLLFKHKNELPTHEMEQLWKIHLLHQFHDILPGTSIARVHDEAVEAMSQLQVRLQRLLASTLESLGESDSETLTFLNSFNFPRKGPFLVPFLEAFQKCQNFETVFGEKKMVVEADEIPPLSSVSVNKNLQNESESPFNLQGRKLDTPMLIAEWDQSGRITSLIHRKSGREIIKPGGFGNQFLFGEDIPQIWDTWDIDRDQRLKRVALTEMATMTKISEGPHQFRIRHEINFGRNSKILQDMVFHASTAQVDFETRIHWDEPHHLLKVGFDLAIFAREARHEIQFGHVKRPTHENEKQDRARFESCAHKWSDISEPDFGVALLNDGKYGVECRHSTISLSLVKGGTRPDPRGDKGTHDVTFSLIPHDGPFNAENVIHPAYLLNQPITFFQGKIRNSPSTLQVYPSSIILETLKVSEDQTALIFRLYESEGKTTSAKIEFHHSPKELFIANLLEENIETLPIDEKNFTLNFHPFEIKTLKVKF